MKIVKGNDFRMIIPVRKMVDGELVRFPLPACTDIVVNLVNAYRRLPVEYTVGIADDSTIEALVHGDRLSVGIYGLEVKGKLFGNSWRSNEYSQIQIVDNNASGDTVFEPQEGEDSVQMDTAVAILPPVVEIKPASSETLGCVIVGDGLNIDDKGRISADPAWVKGSGEDAVITVGCKKSIGNNAVKGAIGRHSTAEGSLTTASKDEAHAEGYNTTASGYHSHAEGYSTTASGDDSHAEGGSTKATGPQSHAEGKDTIARGDYSHAEGSGSQAIGSNSHAEGWLSRTSGYASHAEGGSTIANGECSHAEGYYTRSPGRYSHAQGVYNIPDVRYLDVIGIGTAANDLKNSEFTYYNNDDKEDPKNGYKYLLGVGGYDGKNTDHTKYKSLQEVLEDNDDRYKKLGFSSLGQDFSVGEDGVLNVEKEVKYFYVDMLSYKDTCVMVDDERVLLPAGKWVRVKDFKKFELAKTFADGTPTPNPKCIVHFNVHHVAPSSHIDYIKLNLYYLPSDEEDSTYYAISASCIELGKFVFTAPENMLDWFYNMSAVRKIDISAWDLKNVRGINFMFFNCMELQEIYLPIIHPENIVTADSLFSKCYKLKSINYGNFKLRVINIHRMFYSCLAIEHVDLSMFDVSRCVNASFLFDSCENLTSVNMDGLHFDNLSNCNYMFHNCFKLQEVDFSSTETFSEEGIILDSIFHNCYALKSVKMPKKIKFKISCANIFYDCNSLEAIDVSEWDVAEASAIVNTFLQCYKLTTIDVSKWNVSNAINMSRIFQLCKNLTSLDLSSWDMSSAESILNILYGCESLINLTFGEGFGKMKDECGTLDLGSVSKWNNDTVLSLLNLYDRKANGMGVITIKLHNAAKTKLGADGIAQLTEKGYTIA